MSKPIKPKHNLPARTRYKLEQAAEIAGCSVDDLLHWGAEGIIELRVYVEELFWHMDDLPNCGGTELIAIAQDGHDERSEWGTIGANPDESAGYEALNTDQFDLFGWWTISVPDIARIEARGKTSEDSPVALQLPGDTRQGHMMGVPVRQLTANDLAIPTKELERLINGEAAKDVHSPTPLNRGSRRQPLHGNAERYAKNRESVLKAAMYCKSTWQEQCGTTNRDWARLIDEKAALFWPETGTPPMSLDGIERLLGAALKLPGDVE